MDLLPSSADEFRSREYWDRFFRKRRGKAFEWYGEWHELKPLLLRPECCGAAHRAGGDASNAPPLQILVVGCGNSELSAQLHDHVALPHAPGGRVPAVITSVDFSTVVIDEMKRKNDAARPNMKWHVMDMTATTGPAGGRRKYRWRRGVLGFSGGIGECETAGRDGGAGVRDLVLRTPDDGAPSPATDSCGGSAFSGVVLDATPTMLDGASLPCAVFLVPQGMNRDWLYASEEGQWQLVESANAQRLILVQQNEQPGQLPLTMAQVQEELSPLVLQLAPEYCTKTRYAIPYITTETAAVTGTVRAEVASVTTGAMVVLDDVLSPPHCTRRLVFRRNPNLVQSEALLVPAPPPTPAAPQEEQRGSAGGGASDVIAKEGGKKGGAGGKQKQGKAAAAAADLAAGASKKSKKAAAKAARKQQAAEEVGRSGGVEWVVDHGQLASEYHGAMLAGLSLVAPLMEARESTNAQLTAAVIGLGGGALPMFLRQHFPFTSITVAELDDVMGQVASDHFGFTQDAVLRLHIGDGVALVHAMAAPHHTQGVHEGAVGDDTVAAVQCATAALALSGDAESGGGRRGGAGVDVIFVDADSDDPSTGMSCPAQVFLEPHFLQSARAALNEGGMLVLNVVARASSKYKAAVAAVRQVFPAVYEVDVDGDINRVLFALPATPPALAACADETAAARVLKLGAVRVAALAGRFAPWGKGPSVVKLAGGLKLAA
ncbi:unnamed protein product [Closterium sp. NIES-53]